jgi:hypothetical protein
VHHRLGEILARAEEVSRSPEYEKKKESFED